MHDKGCGCAPHKKRRHKAPCCAPCFTSPIMPIYGLCPIPPFPQPCPLPICMPKGCAPCPFPAFPPLPGPCAPEMVVPTYRVPGPFCCEPELPPPPICYEEGLSGSCSTSTSGYPHGYYMACPAPMPKKMHHYPMHIQVPMHMPKPMHHKGAPWMANMMRETEIEIGGGVEVEKPNMLGNWMSQMGDWFSKGAGPEGGMGMDGGSKWGNWLGKGADGSGMEAGGGTMWGDGKRPMGHIPGTGMGGGKMSNWMNKGAGDGSGMQSGDQGGMDDGSGKKLWPK